MLINVRIVYRADLETVSTSPAPLSAARRGRSARLPAAEDQRLFPADVLVSQQRLESVIIRVFSK
jgi:hypothetical protein